MGDIVSLLRMADSQKDINASVFEVSKMIGFNEEKTVKSVAIKPNLCYYWDASTGYTTDPRVVAAIIDWVRETYGKDVDVRIVEADATAMNTKYAFTILGYRNLAAEKQVELFNLSEDHLNERTVEVNGRQITFKVPRFLLETDLFINVPKLKVMRETKITCALKNIFGCIGYPRKIIYHHLLKEAIVGINKILQPHITIVDGLVALGRFPVKLGLIMASKDPFSIDWVASETLGYNPRRVGFLKLAMREKIWSPKGLSLCGEKSIELFKRQFPKSHIYSSISWKLQLKLLKAYLKLTGDVAPHLIDGL